MSKPIARVAFSVLISLGLIAATYMTVQGAWLTSEVNVAKNHVVNGLQTNLNHDRSTVSELESYRIQSDNSSLQGEGGKDGGCRSESQSSPDD
jgi:hypothetical protein